LFHKKTSFNKKSIAKINIFLNKINKKNKKEYNKNKIKLKGGNI